jgi:hypothetical protein
VKNLTSFAEIKLLRVIMYTTNLIAKFKFDISLFDFDLKNLAIENLEWTWHLEIKFSIFKDKDSLKLNLIL